MLVRLTGLRSGTHFPCGKAEYRAHSVRTALPSVLHRACSWVAGKGGVAYARFCEVWGGVVGGLESGG